MKIKLKIGNRSFQATLEDNEAATAFRAMLPLTVTMADLHQNEKLHRFPLNFHTKDVNPGSIRTGDLMIWSSNTIVLFYKDFPTTYNYTRLGKLDNPAGLSDAVGSGDVRITFEIDQ